MNRNLDGCYFRVKRDGKCYNLCFTDLTQKERETELDGRSELWLKSLCCHLADVINDIGETFDIKKGVIDNG